MRSGAVLPGRAQGRLPGFVCNPALGILPRAFVAACDAGWHRISAAALAAQADAVAGSAIRASPRNPALGILPRAFVAACDA